MSHFYKGKRTRNIFDPQKHGVGKQTFRLSRSKIDLFLNDPLDFYIDRRLGVSRPPGFPFNLNSAVDHLFKKEFDIHRAEGSPHPLMENYGINAVPFDDPKMDIWRDTFKGVEVVHEPTNFTVFGGVDDIWINSEGELIVVDYKATSKDGEVNLDADWQIAYKRQMEVYQWLLRGNGYTVSNTGYFVYANGKRDARAFDGKLEFDVILLPYTGDDSWVNQTLKDAYACLCSDEFPEPNPDNDWYIYRKAVREVLEVHAREVKNKETIINQSLF